MNYKIDETVMYSCRYHVVWCVKYRKKVLTDEVEARLKELIQTRAKDVKCDIILMDIQPDHVHLLVDTSPRVGIDKAVRSIKAYTASILRNEFPSLKSRLPAMWTTKYFATTEPDGYQEAIQRYIEQQNTNPRLTDKQNLSSASKEQKGEIKKWQKTKKY